MKKAFSMLEMVFIIVIIGIISVVSIPRMNNSHLHENAVDLVSKIKYTQHLAMMNDKYDANDADWHRNRWQITFNENMYSIVSNNDTTFAINPFNDGNTTQNVELKGVTIVLSGGCLNETDITFDGLGRPHVGEINDDKFSYTSNQLLENICTITLSDGSDSSIIDIEPETGYARIR